MVHQDGSTKYEHLDGNTKIDGEEVTKSGISMKAVKSDDAEAPIELWDQRLFDRCGNFNYTGSKSHLGRPNTTKTYMVHCCIQ